MKHLPLIKQFVFGYRLLSILTMTNNLTDTILALSFCILTS